MNSNYKNIYDYLSFLNIIIFQDYLKFRYKIYYK